jgi:hypothetical protein
MIHRSVVLASALLLAGAAFAQAPATQTATVTKTTTTTSKPKLGATTVTEKHQSNVTTTAAGNGHIATVKTKTGKTLHYDCSKAGNKNKAACKA